MASTTLGTPEIDPREKRKYYYTDTPQRRALVGLVRFLFRFVMKMEISGPEHFLREGPVILSANHVTTFDAFPMQFAALTGFEQIPCQPG
ncbi:MAG TPA: hypothetical protein VMN99_05915 [Anaerolineales bacterium]|nr:hypothetical protein [Anaerolineales bacterium]